VYGLMSRGRTFLEGSRGNLAAYSDRISHVSPLVMQSWNLALGSLLKTGLVSKVCFRTIIPSFS
jgi:hypothetical protein